MTHIIGIDPGAKGAIALWIGDSIWAIEDMPTVKNAKGRDRVDAAGLVSIIQGFGPEHAFIELVGAMPGQGVPPRRAGAP